MADILARPTNSRRMLGDFLGFEPMRTLTTSGFGFEITKTETGYTVELPVAGYAAEHIDVTLEDRVLTLSGRTEQRNFTRALLISEEIDPETIGAKVEHGMLTISLSRYAKAQPRKINVTVAS